MIDNQNSPVQIAIGDTGITVIPGEQKDNLKDLQSANLSKLEQPQTLCASLQTFPDVPSPAQQSAQVRELTNKSLLCALERLYKMMQDGTRPTAIASWTELTLKLLDAREAYLWADSFRSAILRNPKLMSPNGKGLGTKGFQSRSNGVVLDRLNRGDTRTTPKKLLNTGPQDDDPIALTG